MSTLSPDDRLERLANAHQLSRAVQVAARLGLGQQLTEGPRSLSELAAATGSNPVVLGKLLRFLAQLGVVQALDDDRFGPTPLSDRLHRVDNLAQGEEGWQAWSALPEALASGEPAFPKVHGASFYRYAADHPRQAAHWRESQGARAQRVTPPVAAVLPLEGATRIVDVGGGQGVLLAELLKRHPGCRGLLFDLPEAVVGSGEVFAAAGVQQRAQVVAGDAFDAVPAGADLYLLCRVLSNWSDESAIAGLSALRRALQAGARTPSPRLVIVDALMPEGPAGRAFAGPDLHHFLLWGGGFRTLPEVRQLLSAAGLTQRDHHITEDDAWHLLICTA
ncbi:MAG: methyltransferase [Acidobacteriota bacterium]